MSGFNSVNQGFLGGGSSGPGPATTVPISGLLAAESTNSISNGTFQQSWAWALNNSVNNGLALSSSGNQSNIITNAVLNVSVAGTFNVGLTNDVAVIISNTKTSTFGNNFGLILSAENAANNYALIVPANGGFVGIGTSQPLVPLHVNGQALINSAADIQIGDVDGANNFTVLSVNDGTKTVYADNTIHDVIFGINTVNPTQALDVVGNVKFSAALMPNNDSGGPGTFLMSNGAGVSPTWGSVPAPSLTSTYIGYGDGSNLLTGSNKLTWDNTNSDLLLRYGTDSMARIYRGSGGLNRFSLYDGDGNELILEAGSGYLFMTNTDLAIARDNDFGNPNLLIEPTAGSNENALKIAGYEGEVFKINKHGWVGIGVTPTVSLDVVGDTKLTSPATTTTGLDVSSSTLTTGALATFTMTGTAAASNTKRGLVINSTGTNSTASQTVTGMTINVGNLGTTNTNVGLDITASGATTNNALRLTGNVIFPTDNSFDIGASGATRPRTGYFGTGVVSPQYESSTDLVLRTNGGSRNIYIANNTIGNLWLFNSSGHLLPATNAAYDIGSGTFRVNGIHANGITAYSTATLAATGFYGLATQYTNPTASQSALKIVSSLFTGGSGTTTHPLELSQPTAATAVTTWNTNGTFKGFNSGSGFTGNFLDAHVNGGASVFSVNYQGNVTTVGNINALSGNVVFSSSFNQVSNVSGGVTGLKVFSNGSTARTLDLLAGSGTVDIQQWQNSSGTALSVVNYLGNLGIGTTSPQSKLDVAGSTARAINLITTNTTLDATHSTIVVTSGTPTITLPAAGSTNTRRVYTIVNHTGSAVTISSYLNFSGAGTTTVPANGFIVIQSDATNWYLISN